MVFPGFHIVVTMVAFAPQKNASQAPEPEKQEGAQPSVPSVDRAEIFERMRAASEQRISTEKPATSSAPTPAQPSVSHERGLEIEKRAQDLYRSMHGGLTGWGTEEAQLLNALKGLSPAEVRLLKEVYATRFNTQLEKDITSELSGADLAQARAALQGDRAAEKAAALYRAMDGIGTDEDAIVATLSGLSAEEQAKVAGAYKENYGQDLDAALRRELSGDDLRRVTALREGKPLTAAAVELQQAMGGLGTDEAAINAVMKRHSPEQMQAVAREYQQLYGSTLESALQSELSGHELSESMALQHGDSTAAKVAQLRGAMEGLGTSEETIFSVLDGTTAAEREGLKAAFQAQTGTSLERALSSELSGADLERANALLAHGKLSDVEKLRFAFQGLGTDEATIKEVLRNRSKEEVSLLKTEYEARYHESLEARLMSELGGSDQFRAVQALKGRPTTVDEALQSMQELDAFERSGILSGVIGAFSKEGDRIQEQLAIARFDIEAAKRDGVITAEEQASIERTLRFAEGNIDVHVETRDAIADTTATVAAVAGSTAVVIGTGGLATPGVIAMAAATGGVSYAGTKYAVQGKGYDGENLASDIGIGAVEGTVTALTAGTATAVKNAAQQGAKQAVTTASKTAVRETVVESAGSTAQDALRPDTWAGGAAAGVANLTASAVTTAVTSGALNRVAHVKSERVDGGASRGARAADTNAPSQPPSREGTSTVVRDTPGSNGPVTERRSQRVAVEPQVANDLSGEAAVAARHRVDAPPVSTEHFRFATQTPKEWALAQATSAEHRVANMPSELHDARLGIPGRVRTVAELSDAQVAQVLNAQLNHVNEKEIGELLSSFGPERKGLAGEVLGVLSRAGNLDSFSDIVEALRSTKYGGASLYVPSNGGLADSLTYLGNSKTVLRAQVLQMASSDINPGSIVLLDREMLQRLKTDALFVKKLLSNKVTLAHPVGFVDGINPFNAPTLGDIQDRVSHVMKGVESLRAADPKASTEELIGQVLRQNVMEELKGIDQGLLKRVDFLSPPTSKSGGDISGIVANLNGSPGMTEAHVTEVLSKLHESWRPLAREAVAQLSEVQSHRSMAAMAREQFDKIVSYARSEGVAPEDIIFAVKDGHKKSYGIANYIFKEANAGKLGADQFVSMNSLAQAAREKGARKTLVVALDDFSGSGSSLLSSTDVRGTIRNAVGPTVPIVCAPYVATTKAFEYLEKVRENDLHVTMIPGRVVASGHESQLAKADNGALKPALDLVMGFNGFSGTGSFVSLPYMGPDNNCSLFGQEYFNPYFIINKKKEAVKTSGTMDWNPGSNSVFADVVQREIGFARGDLDKATTLSPHEGLRMLKRIEELTAVAEKVSILDSSQATIQSLANDLAEKCRGEVRRVVEAVRNGPKESVPQQLLLDFEAAQELSRRLLLDEIGDTVKVASANHLGGVS